MRNREKCLPRIRDQVIYTKADRESRTKIRIVISRVREFSIFRGKLEKYSDDIPGARCKVSFVRKKDRAGEGGQKKGREVRSRKIHNLAAP